jgi:hypothetical protein
MGRRLLVGSGSETPQSAGRGVVVVDRAVGAVVVVVVCDSSALIETSVARSDGDAQALRAMRQAMNAASRTHR